MYVYPRLPRGQADALLAGIALMDLSTARAYGGLSHPAAAPVATGFPRVPTQILEDLARSIRELADERGFPDPLARQSVARFDQACGELLVRQMHIVPADAGSEGVWSFLTLVVLPDIAIWRFPERSRRRFVGLPRNTFRRLWWRAFTLGDSNHPGDDLGEPLGEDELVQIFERTRLSRSAPLARAIVTAVRRVPPEAGVARSQVVRELAKRVRRSITFISVDVLSGQELSGLVFAALDEVLLALRQSL